MLYTDNHNMSEVDVEQKQNAAQFLIAHLNINNSHILYDDEGSEYLRSLLMENHVINIDIYNLISNTHIIAGSQTYQHAS